MKTLPSLVLLFAIAAGAAFIVGAATAGAGLVSLAITGLFVRDYTRPIPCVATPGIDVAARTELRPLPLAA